MHQERNHLRWWLLVVLCLSVLVVMLDNSIVNVALPTLSRKLNASTEALQWIVDAYTLPFAGLLLVSGHLGDRLGRRRVLQAGLVLFAVFSVAAAVSRNSAELIAARAAMGAAAALVFPATLAILNNVFTDQKERVMAIGIWSGVSGIGIALGPVIGGVLLEHFDWSSVFYVSVPVAVIALIAGRFLLPESKDPKAGRPDPVGAALSVIGIVLLTWSIIEAPGHGWGSLTTIACLAGSVAILAVFAWWESRRLDPLLDVGLFRNPRFTAASTAISLTFFGLLGFTFMITQYFQVVRGYDPLRGGVVMLPFAAIIVVFAAPAMILMKRVGTKIVVGAGMVLMSGGFVIAAVTPVNANYWHQIIASMALMAAGLAFATGPATEAIMGALPPAKAGVGSAVNDMTREVGALLGVAILGSVLNSVYSSRALTALTSLGASHAVGVRAGGSIVSGLATAAHLPAAARQAATSGVQDAFMTGLHQSSVIAAAVTGLAALIALLFLPPRAAPSAPSAPTAPQQAQDTVGAA